MRRRSFIQSLLVFGGAVATGLTSLSVTKAFPFIRRSKTPESVLKSKASGLGAEIVLPPLTALKPDQIAFVNVAMQRKSGRWVHVSEMKGWTRMSTLETPDYALEMWYMKIGKETPLIRIKLEAPTAYAVTVHAVDNVETPQVNPSPN